MAATIRQDKNGIWVVYISGALRKEEMDAIQDVGIRELCPHEDAKLLVMVAEDFVG